MLFFPANRRELPAGGRQPRSAQPHAVDVRSGTVQNRMAAGDMACLSDRTNPNMSKDFKLDLVSRPRRLRRTAAIRELVAETRVTPADLIAPLFVVDGKKSPEEVPSMPGVFRLSIPDLIKECRALWKLGIRAVAIFPKMDPRLKNAGGNGPWCAVQGISRLGPQGAGAIPDLVGLLRHADPNVRSAAAEALGRIGPAAEVSLPELERATHDENQWVRKAAQEAVPRVRQAP